MAILLDWLSKQGSWIKYGGGPGNNGKTKRHYAGQIIKQFEEAGVQSSHHINQVTNKISELEQSYRKAADFLANTGSGLESPGDIDKEKFKRCKYYDVLAPILGEKGASRPLATNHDPDTDDEEVIMLDNSAEGTPIMKDHSTGKMKSSPSIAALSEGAKKVSKNFGSPFCRTDCFSKTKKSKVSHGGTATKAKQKVSIRTTEKKKPSKKVSGESLMEEFKEIREKEMTAKLQEVEAKLLAAKVAAKDKLVAIETKKRAAEAQLQVAERSRKLELRSAFLRERASLKEQGVPQAEIDLVLPLSEIIENNAPSAPHFRKPVSVQHVDVCPPPVEAENCTALTIESASSAESASDNGESSAQEDVVESTDDESVAYIFSHANPNYVESDGNDDDDDPCLGWGPAFTVTGFNKRM